MPDIRRMEARVEGREGLFVPENRATLASKLRPLTMEGNFRKVLSALQIESDSYPTIRNKKVGKVVVSSAVRRGESYDTYSLGLTFDQIGSCRVFSRYRIQEEVDGGVDTVHVDAFDNPDKLFWLQRDNSWELIELNSRLADQRELPIARVVGAEPDRNLSAFSSTCLKLVGGSW